MRFKSFLYLLPILVLTLAFPRQVLAAEVPPSALTLNDELYADLALRNDLDHVSLYFFDGNIGNTVSINPDKTWDPASTIKLYVAMYAFDQSASGKIDLNQTVTITDQNVAPGVTVESGYTSLTSGQSVTVYELIDRMITQSGNTSYNTLLDLLDRREITKYIHDLGLVNSSIGAKLNLDDTQQALDASVAGYGPNVTNADDFARAFILINGKRIPGSPGLFDMLSRQKLNDMIPAQLPKNVIVAHKTGELDPFYHDGGIIVDQNKNYVLSVFTDAGDPSLVAHLSNLVYTKDVNLVGGTFTLQKTSEVPNAPLDPIVANGEVQSNVLAAVTTNVKVPVVTAADLGIDPTDLSYILTSQELPRVLIPADSRFHFLVDWGDKLSSLYPAPPALYVMSETGKLRLRLAEASDLIARGKTDGANGILQRVNESIGGIAENAVVSQDAGLQKLVEGVSQTRFAILKSEFENASAESKTGLIKEIAGQAKDAVSKVKPFVKGATEARALSQQPLVGQVVSSNLTSVTLKTSDGSQVTVPVDSQLRTKSVDQSGVKIENITQIPTGTQIALVGASMDKKIKPFFVLANIPKELSDSRPVFVVKVNLATNTMVVAGDNGVPVQIDLTRNTVIKGDDTSVALGELKAGDVIVVHGTPIAPPGALKPSATPGVAPGGAITPPGSSGQPGNTTIPQSTNVPIGSAAPGAGVPGQSLVPSLGTPIPPSGGRAAVTKLQGPAPQVIKADVIQVVQKASDARKEQKKEEHKKEAPKPVVPPATPTTKK